MENDEGSPIRKTPAFDTDYGLSDSRRSSTSLSLVGIGETPIDLREMDLYDRAQYSPMSPPVHPRCHSTTDYTTTEKSFYSTTPTPKFQCTRSQCPIRNSTTGRPTVRSVGCTPMHFSSPSITERPRSLPRSPPPPCIPCATQSPRCGAQCARSTTMSPRVTTTTTKCTDRTTASTCPTTASTCPTTASTCPTMGTTRSPISSPTFKTSSPTCTRGSPTCTTRSPQFVTRSPQFVTRSPTFTMRTTARCDCSPTLTRRTTARCDCSPEGIVRTPPTSPSTQYSPPAAECPQSYSPELQSKDSRGTRYPSEVPRETRRNDSYSHREERRSENACPLEICRMRSRMGSGTSVRASSVPSAAASRAILSSPTNAKRVPFSGQKSEDDSGSGGVVRWTEKCSQQRCQRPVWSSNRWSYDKPVTRTYFDSAGPHPPLSRCAQEYDLQKFGAMDGRAMRKCDCCDKRSYTSFVPNQSMPTTYQTIDRAPQISTCGCDGYARGINHYRQPPPPMPQNPFDNSSSAYFNRLHKGMPFSKQPPPPPPPAPSFNPMPQPPFNATFNYPPPNISSVTSVDNSLNMMPDENFTSPQGCAGCDPTGQPETPNQNINMVTNPHMFNSTCLAHNSAVSNTPQAHNQGYLPYGQNHPHDGMNSKESNI